MNGISIHPLEVPGWLQARNLVWTCLCGWPVKFERGPEGTLQAVCDVGERGCPFQGAVTTGSPMWYDHLYVTVDLHRVRSTTRLPANDYASYHPGQTLEEYMEVIRRETHIHMPGYDLPFVEGFCGNYIQE